MSKVAKALRKKDEVEDIPETDFSRSKIIGRGLLKHRRLPLRAVREAVGRTQLEVAEIAGMNQGDVSRLEHQEDFRVSTLRRYASALGAKVEVVLRLPSGRRVVVDL